MLLAKLKQNKIKTKLIFHTYFILKINSPTMIVL